MTNQPPIDAVITWVDGNDPAHREKLNAYLKTLGKNIPGSANPTRFRECGELEYCVASILKFAPWVRHIYIVTDNQTPPFLRKPLSPRLEAKIKLVDHTSIFRDYENALPVFCSRSIETVLWRIPDLAERFICFNDDMVLTQPVRSTDFFRNNNLVLRGHWQTFSERTLAYKLKHTALLRRIKHRNPKPQRASHIHMQELSAKACGFDKEFFYIPHQPHPVFKSLLAELFEKHPDWLEFNLSHKLRHPDQLWSFALAAHQALNNGQAVIDNTLSTALIKPQHRHKTGIYLQLRQISHRPGKAFICIQSLDNATEPVQHTIINWLKKTVGPLDTTA